MQRPELSVGRISSHWKFFSAVLARGGIRLKGVFDNVLDAGLLEGSRAV